MKTNQIKRLRRFNKDVGSKHLDNDLKTFGKKQLFSLMDRNLELPFQIIQL